MLRGAANVTFRKNETIHSNAVDMRNAKCEPFIPLPPSDLVRFLDVWLYEVGCLNTFNVLSPNLLIKSTSNGILPKLCHLLLESKVQQHVLSDEKRNAHLIFGHEPVEDEVR